MFKSLSLLVALIFASRAWADDSSPQQRVKDAIERGVAVVTRGAQAYPKHRQCFSCHHQTLPLMALSAARAAGHKIDEAAFTTQVTFTRKFFEGRQESLREGKRIGGAAATVAYGLWLFEIAEAKPDDVSDALVANLLKLQEADGRWRPPSVRPPLEESHVACTVLAAYTAKLYARGDHQKAAADALEKAGHWLTDVKLESTEDRVFGLLWHTRFEPNEQLARAAREPLLSSQRADGGWGQTATMESDAYATGQAIVALLGCKEAGAAQGLEKGIDYLLSTQQSDGSWHVATRSKPVQKFFDNGDPHGADQFISMAATSWATAALANYASSSQQPANSEPAEGVLPSKGEDP